MADVLYDQNLDINYGTLSRIRRRTPPLTYAYSTYQFYNTFFRGNIKERGKELKGFHVKNPGEENAGFTNVWAEDTTTIKNIVQEYKIPWRHAKVSMAWNEFERSTNAPSAEQVFDVWELKYNAAMRDLVDELFKGCLYGPTSATDVDSPYAISTWLALGTDDTAGFTCYTANYRDGSGTAFNKGGLTCSATANPYFATYYDDHNGNIDDSLLTQINTANLKLNFQPPVIPKKLEVDRVVYAAYTTANVITKLNAFYAKADDNMGYRPTSHYNTPVLPGGVPLVYCPPLDLADHTEVYGTDPIFGVNHNLMYPVFLKDWDFAVTRDTVANRHLVKEYFMDLGFNIWNELPRHSGYLISEQ